MQPSAQPSAQPKRTQRSDPGSATLFLILKVRTPPTQALFGEYTLGRGWAYISDMSSTSGYMGAKYVQEFGPIFFAMSSARGYMG